METVQQNAPVLICRRVQSFVLYEGPAFLTSAFEKGRTFPAAIVAVLLTFGGLTSLACSDRCRAPPAVSREERP